MQLIAAAVSGASANPGEMILFRQIAFLPFTRGDHFSV